MKSSNISTWSTGRSQASYEAFEELKTWMKWMSLSQWVFRELKSLIVSYTCVKKVYYHYPSLSFIIPSFTWEHYLPKTFDWPFFNFLFNLWFTFIFHPVKPTKNLHFTLDLFLSFTLVLPCFTFAKILCFSWAFPLFQVKKTKVKQGNEED